MNKILFWICVTVLIALAISAGFLFLSGKFDNINKGNNNYSDSTSIRLAWLTGTQFAGLYMAEKEEVFAKNNLSVELRSGGIDFPAIQLVASGSDDFGIARAEQLLSAREKGVPVVALAVVYKQSPYAILTLKSSGITKLEQLVGKKVGVKPGREDVYWAMLKSAGIDRKSIEEVPIKVDLSPLITGQIDAWCGFTITEMVTLQQKGYEVNVINPKDYGISMYGDILFTTEDMINKKPDLVGRVTRSVVEGWELAIANPNKALEYTLEYDKQLIKYNQSRQLEESIPLIKGSDGVLGIMDNAEWLSAQKILIDNGIMKSAIDISKIYTNQFLQ